MSSEENLTFAAQAPAAAPTPETIEINGVTYRREADDNDKRVNQIKRLQAIAQRTGLSLRQVCWFQWSSGQGVLPD